MPRKYCETCEGLGHVWHKIPDVRGWGWTERKDVCDACDGEGDMPLTALDLDGARVKVISTGVIGVANIMGSNTIIVMKDNDDEVDVSSLEDLELCES